MSKEKKKSKILCFLFLVGIALCLWGCTIPQEESEKKAEQQETEQNETLYAILEHDTENQSVRLYSYTDGNTYHYTYNASTLFKDTYQNITTSTNFYPGRVVKIGKTEGLEYLTDITLSSEVWDYENIQRFSIDEKRGILTIADTKYAITNQTFIFSNGLLIEWADISENDTLTVIGKEKKVLSVIVTKGQGKLALTNTELFEGSFLQLNTNIFSIITENMVMELPEGKYTLKVANNGWGGTTEIEILRGETTTVDLETLKGEGYKKGLVTFQIDVENVTMKIDGKTVDISQPIELAYGIHSLVITAENYSEWKRYLNVNSAEAVIEIELEEETQETEKTSEEMQETEEPLETEIESTEENSSETEELMENLLNELLQSNILTRSS